MTLKLVQGKQISTASWAVNAISSSYAINSLTASYVLPLNQKVIITGSLTNGKDVITTGEYSHAEGIGWYIQSSDVINTTQDDWYFGGDNVFVGGTPLTGSTTSQLLFQGDFTTLESFPITVTFAFGNVISPNYGYYPTPVITNITYDGNTDISTVFVSNVPQTYEDIAGKQFTIATGYGSHAEGVGTLSQGTGSHAEGIMTVAYGTYSHAEGGSTVASGSYSHAEGFGTIASGSYSHTEGIGTLTLGGASHAEGQSTRTLGEGTHAEGFGTIASGSYSHTEGYYTVTSGSYSHAEGNQTKAIGQYSHAEGQGTVASGSLSHTEGNSTLAIGVASHAEGFQTVALGNFQHVQGQYNLSSSAQSAFIVGNGTANNARSNLIFASASQFQVTGSVIATQGFTGSLFGTASWAISSSQSTSSSFAITSSFAISASQSRNAVSASYSTFAQNSDTAISASSLVGFQAATVDQINKGEPNNGSYAYVVRAQELEQSKHATINIYNNLNFT